MNSENYKILLMVCLVFLTSWGCVENISDTASTKPTITLQSPSSGDTVEVRRNPITYSASDAPGGSGLASYEVFINGESNEIFQQNDDGTNPELFLTVDSTLLNSRISYFVTVYNQAGGFQSSETQTNLFVRENTDPPEAPFNLNLSRVSDTEVLIVWEDTSNIEEGFEIWRKVGEGEFAILTDLPADSKSFRDQGLSPVVIYQYKIRAFNKFGNSAFSITVSSTGGANNAPTNLAAEALGSSIVRLTWEDNSILENGYRIERKTISEDDWTSVGLVGRNVEEFFDSGLSPGATYQYRVAALLSDSEVYSSIVQVTTSFSDIPPPSNLTATFNATNNSVIIEWIDNTFRENGTIIERKNGSNDIFIEVGRTDTDVNTFEDTSVEEENIYTYRAQHTTTEGFKTPFSNEDTVFVPQLLLTAPQNLEITEVVEGQEYVLTWEYPSDVDKDGFELWLQNLTAGSDYELFKVYGPTIVADRVNLPIIGNEYNFKIRAFLGSDFSTFSNEVSTSSSEFTLEAISFTNSNVVLQWTDPFTGDSDELLFVVERNNFSANPITPDWQEIGTAQGTDVIVNFTDSNVTSGLTYQWRVYAQFQTGKVYANDGEAIEITIPN